MHVDGLAHVMGRIDVTGDDEVPIYGDGGLTVEGASANVSTPNQNATR